MSDLLKIMRRRRSARVLFDPARRIPKRDLNQLLEAARWAPTAHNMQNFEIVMVEDRDLLMRISQIHNPVSVTFVRENYRQLSFSEAELKAKKVGILAATFPPEWLKPDATPKEIRSVDRSGFQERQIESSSALGIVLYDPKRRAPASQNDFLGAISLGCVMENIWLMAESLGIAVHIVSSLSAPPAETEIKRLLKIPRALRIAFSFRLGYAAEPVRMPRVRRDIRDFTHFNSY
ncbi:MAG TPA: nitroreductase family protein [Bryobacteraceae bacterium]|nr:nitroreductase family protein [Bryobacteraceae bacterium]